MTRGSALLGRLREQSGLRGWLADARDGRGRLGAGLRRLLGQAPAGPPRSVGIEVEHTYVR